MIIVRLCGGLGNQMFQYALYAKLRQLHKCVKLDKSWIEDDKRNLRGTSIFEVFKVEENFANTDEIEKLGDFHKNLISSVRRKLFGKKKSYYKEPKVGTYDPSVLECQDAYIDGYWQTEKYFGDCREQLLCDFSLKNALNEESAEILKKIKSISNSVSVHIRMGDYNTDANSKIYGNICTQEYYEQAMQYFEKKYDDVTFFVFSNEPEKVKDYFENRNHVIVDFNSENMGWADMFLMSQCEHNIIANSTFSWWGAWLNQYLAKEVIAPKKWINTQDMRDICPKEWIRM